MATAGAAGGARTPPPSPVVVPPRSIAVMTIEVFVDRYGDHYSPAICPVAARYLSTRMEQYITERYGGTDRVRMGGSAVRYFPVGDLLAFFAIISREYADRCAQVG